MKKTLAALAVLGAFAGSAVAADVTLYGAVDTGFKYTHEKVQDFDGTSEDATNTFEMANGINETSSFGLTGSEELGNGLTVSFKLENGFNSDDGTFGDDNNRLFDREASLSVAGGFGTVSFGRMGAAASAEGDYDTVFAIGDSFDGGDEFARFVVGSDIYDNMITYQTPQIAGLQATVQYSFKIDSKDEASSKVEGRSTADRYASFALTGEYGPAQFVAAYELQKYSTTLRETHDVNDGQSFYLGANVDFEVAKIFAMGQYFTGQRAFSDLDDKAFSDAGIADLGKKGIKGYGLHLGTIVPVAGGELTVGAYYSDGKLQKSVGVAEDVDMSYVGAAARYCYSLSERTTLYVGGGYGELKVDKITGAEQDAKRKTGGAYLGLSHTF